MDNVLFLRLYRIVSWAMCVLGLVYAALGLVLGVSGGLVTALSAVITGLVLAIGGGAIAQGITLVLGMNAHLDELMFEQKHTNEVLLRSALAGQKASHGTLAEVEATRVAAGLTAVNPPPQVTGASIRIVASDAMLYSTPLEEAVKERALREGEQFQLVGDQLEGWYCTRQGFIRVKDAELLN